MVQSDALLNHFCLYKIKGVILFLLTDNHNPRTKTNLMLKKFLFVVCTCFISISIMAQKTETIRVRGAEATIFITSAQNKYATFVPAKVFLKDGDVASGKFNFDYLNQVMKYIGEKGDTLAIANEKDINYISTPIDTFFYDKKYYEWIASSASARLAVRRTYKLIGRDKIGAYGTASPNFKVESHDAILDVSNHNLNVNEELVFTKANNVFYKFPKRPFCGGQCKKHQQTFSG